MSVVTIPVAVQRWFQDKEGWAFHPSLGGKMRRLLDAADRQLKADRESDFIVPWPGGWLVGELVTDHECLNENARGRWPRVFRVAAVTGDRPDARRTQRVLQALRALPVPAGAGAQTALVLRLSPPPLWTPLREPRPPLFRAVLALVGLGEGRSDHRRALDLAGLFEQRWAAALDDGTAEAIRSVLADRWCGLTSGGRFLSRDEILSLRQPSSVLAEFPALSGEEEQFAATVSGENTLVIRWLAQLGGARVGCLRVYSRDRRTDHWSMTAAVVAAPARVVAAQPTESTTPSLPAAGPRQTPGAN